MNLRILAAALVLFATSPVHADASITIYFRNGAIVHGELVERIPNHHVTVKLATGEVRRYEWNVIDHDSLGAASTSPATFVPIAPPVTIIGAPPPTAPVTILGADGVRLERLTGTGTGSGWSNGHAIAIEVEHWSAECVAPCGRPVPAGSYRLIRDGVTASRTFDLAGGERLDVTTGNNAAYQVGYYSVLFGAPAIGCGALLYALDTDKNTGIAAGFAIGGVILVGIGLPLLLTNRTTVTIANQTVSIGPHGLAF